MAKLALAGGEPVRTAPFPQWPVIGPEEREGLLSVFDSGKWWFGEKVHEFEQAFAQFQDARFGAACATGSASLEMGLFACGIGPGDEVIVPAYTFVATPNSVLQVNAIPVFADVEVDTANLDLADVARKITPRTKAIMPVHFAGLPVDMDALAVLAVEHGLKIVEDACHSWGSKWKGKGTGALGHCGGFSFQISKNITSGEGGILLSDDEDIATAAANYANYGRESGKGFYDHFTPGTNYRMTELQAAILLGQLTRLEQQTLKRQDNAALLDEALRDVPGLAPMRSDSRVTRRSYHMYNFLFAPDAWDGVTRDRFIETLVAEGIPAGHEYPHPLYRNPLFQRAKEQGPGFCPWSCPFYGEAVDYTQVNCPGAERLCREAVWIGHPVLLGDEGDMQDIIAAIRKVRDHRKELL
ncbi:MAG: DegT/DnrJ/EryC1/StrS family aminotransferase [Candidatus Brocadiia bacterium]|jgi:dTDP-4-amino-4,6-dideoxygalactose transaminase|nr:DegT/DnrJ/EryC1/StrS family aminotransferase [Candidatus Brocadiia bacterium]